MVGVVGTEIIKHQERIEQWHFAVPEHPLEVYTGPFYRWTVFDNRADCPCVFHGSFLKNGTEW
jgi:hypothetical protein